MVPLVNQDPSLNPKKTETPETPSETVATESYILSLTAENPILDKSLAGVIHIGELAKGKLVAVRQDGEVEVDLATRAVKEGSNFDILDRYIRGCDRKVAWAFKNSEYRIIFATCRGDLSVLLYKGQQFKCVLPWIGESKEYPQQVDTDGTLVALLRKHEGINILATVSWERFEQENFYAMHWVDVGRISPVASVSTLDGHVAAIGQRETYYTSWQNFVKLPRDNILYQFILLLADQRVVVVAKENFDVSLMDKDGTLLHTFNRQFLQVVKVSRLTKNSLAIRFLKSPCWQILQVVNNKLVEVKTSICMEFEDIRPLSDSKVAVLHQGGVSQITLNLSK